MSKQKKKQKLDAYVSRFLQLKCASDVLGATYPIGNHVQKEISESMAIIKRLKSIVLKKPMQYTLYDMCAGNALTSVLAAHLLPVKNAIAIDIRKRKRSWENVKRFAYAQEVDIREINPEDLDSPSIIIGVHACKSLAEQIVSLYLESDAEHLILMPCCAGNVKDREIPSIFTKQIGKHAAWAWQLARQSGGHIYEDTRCLSARNLVIVASKTLKKSGGGTENRLIKQLSKEHRKRAKVLAKLRHTTT